MRDGNGKNFGEEILFYWGFKGEWEEDVIKEVREENFFWNGKDLSFRILGVLRRNNGEMVYVIYIRLFSWNLWFKGLKRFVSF